LFPDLQMYVYSGMEFPKTKEEYEKELPISYFRALEDIDSNLYKVRILQFSVLPYN
jgi:hypothetical protein